MATDHRIRLEASARRARVVFNGTTVAESDHAVILHEAGHTQVLYFPRRDVRLHLMRPTDHRTHCPYKGDAAYWTLTVGEKSAENAVWSYENPIESVAGIRGYMAFYKDRVDAIEATGDVAAKTS